MNAAERIREAVASASEEPIDGRLIPLIIIPLWDAQLAADEVRRNAARGVHAVCFSEIPPKLGLPPAGLETSATPDYSRLPK